VHALLALALALAPAPVAVPPTDDPAARAAELFSEGEFLAAAEAFEEAFAETGDPALVFGRAQALRRAGNCAAAIDEFERFIALGPPPSDIEEAEKVIDACRQVLGVDASAEPPQPDPRPPVAPPPPRRPWHRDPAGIALVTSGLVFGAIGGGLLGGAFGRAEDRSGEGEDSWESRERDVRVLSTAGYALIGTGAALLVAGVVRWAIVARQNRKAQRPTAMRRSL
jgi:tetratricopeptide (TPR) repeat protein